MATMMRRMISTRSATTMTSILRPSNKTRQSAAAITRSSSLSRRSLSTKSNDGIVLHSEWIHPSPTSELDPTNDKENHSIVFLHGLLGNGRNLKTMAKKMCAAVNRPGLLLDLPGHGGSVVKKSHDTDTDTDTGVSSRSKTTFDDCLRDIQATLRHAGVIHHENNDTTKQFTLVGHSLGGRLALQYAHRLQEKSLSNVWLLDTVPGQPHKSVVTVLDIVESILSSAQDWSKINKKQMTATLISTHGLDAATAGWLASSFKVDKMSGMPEFGFSPATARDLVEDFGNQDFLGALQQVLDKNNNDNSNNIRQLRVDLVRGAKNTAWEESGHMPHLQALQEQHEGRFGFHTVQAGHWVHVEDLPGLLQAFNSVHNKSS
jgi:pimeloyl-ACP methyl ester carboxylesterase